MANPFFVEPANPLQALMLGVQGYDRARKTAKENAQTAALKEAGDVYASGGDTRGVIGKLIGLDKADTVKALAAMGPKDTDEQREYNMAVQQGYKGTFMDYKTALKQAGATKINNTVQTGENEYAKAVGKDDAERFAGYNKAGRSAQSALTSLDVLERAAESPDFYSGPGAEKFVLPIRQATAAFGGDPKAAATMETFRANASKAALESMGGSLGAGFSNADRDFVLNQVPNLATSPEGNKQLIQITRKVKQREIEIAKMARDYASKNKGRLDSGFEDKLTEYAEKNPLFPRAAGNGNRMRWTPDGGLQPR